MLYNVFGPYKLETKKGAKDTLDLSSEARKRFWDRAEKKSGLPLRDAHGCYLFAHRIGQKDYEPWYVGQTKRHFKQEVFNGPNRKKYCKVYERHIESGSAVVFLIAKMKAENKLAKPPKKGSKKRRKSRQADFVERIVMQHAFMKNPRLCNKAGTRYLKRLQIQGILNNDDDNSSTRKLRNALGIRRAKRTRNSERD